ncbi:hypothetical protein G9A89_010134 [Geosiphon pyriformis]|nr:hypothetical protein G9A89_010134 [Geosiphon pyriformis]
MVNVTEEIRKIEIIDNIYSLAQQIFQLIQHQEIEITINQQTIHYKNTAKISQNKAQKRLENVIDKIMTKIKLAINEQQIVGLHQDLTRETWTWWMQQFPKNYCYFHLEQHVNIQNLYTNKTKWLFDIIILRQLEQFVRKNNLTTQAQDCLVKDLCEWVGHIQKIQITYQKIASHQAKKKIDKLANLESYG